MPSQTFPTPLSYPTYRWTQSGAVAGEYYLELIGGGDPGLTEPDSVVYGETRVALGAGTVGSLTNDTWDWGDNDTLGFSTVYVKLASALDPDAVDSPYGHLVANITSDLGQDGVPSLVTATVYGAESITKTTLAAATVTQVGAAVDSSKTHIRELWNESGGQVWFAFADSAPANTDSMRAIANGGAYLLDHKTGLSNAKLYAYSTAGGVVKYVVA